MKNINSFPQPLLSLSDKKGHAKIYIKVDLDAHTYDKCSQLLEYFGVCDFALVNVYITLIHCVTYYKMS
jgi:hypothetical protein